MKITHLETVVFGVDDVAACVQFVTDYGLRASGAGAYGQRFEALDGTGLEIAARGAAQLPRASGASNMLRKTIYGVADTATLAAIARELGRDRATRMLPDGSLEAEDDMGFTLGFQLDTRRSPQLEPERVNAPGSPPQRPVNVIAVEERAEIVPRALSHLVYFVPDVARAEAFYVERLGFVCTDRFVNVGPFMRPAGMSEHHSLFLIQTPPHMKGVEHFTFHMANANDVLEAGTRMVNKGHHSFWGPGRHRLGSNWFWYFSSPFGCRMEFDADMDIHDDHWIPRAVPMNADNSQAFLFESAQLWVPGPPPAQGQA